MNNLRKGLPADRQGFTLIEVLLVVSIIMILAIIAMMNLQGQTAKAMDIRRKTDLYILRKGLEDYYNDSTSYPEQSAVNDCGSPLGSYLPKIPCDPVSKSPYGYFPSISSSGGYRLCAKLSDKTDPAIATMGCGGTDGCGVGGPPSGGVYNFCLASGVTASAIGTTDFIAGGGPASSPTLTPTPTLAPSNYVACTPGGECNSYDNPSNHGCPVSWQFDCPGYIDFVPGSGVCANLANRCTD